jgi:hypothetical protein
MTEQRLIVQLRLVFIAAEDAQAFAAGEDAESGGGEARARTPGNHQLVDGGSV